MGPSSQIEPISQVKFNAPRDSQVVIQWNPYGVQILQWNINHLINRQ